MLYDMTAKEYRLYVENKAGTVYLQTSEDLKEFLGRQQRLLLDPSMPGHLHMASEIALNPSRYDKVTKKFTNPYNTS